MTFLDVWRAQARLGAPQAPDRSFATSQFAAAGLGAAAPILFWIFVGFPGWAEWGAFLWLGGFGVFGWLAQDPRRDEMAKAGSIGWLAGFIAYVCVFTGGIWSPFLPWLLVLPVEAALTRRMQAIATGIGAAAGAALVLAILSLAGALPGPMVPPEADGWLRALVAVGASIYAGAAALSLAVAERSAEAAARRSELVFRSLGESASDIILRLGSDGLVRFASPASRDVLGVPPEGLAGRSLFAFVHAEDADELSKAIEAANLSGCVATAEVRCLSAHGLRWLEFRLKPVREADGAAGDLVATARDTTTRRTYETQLEKARDLAEASSRSKSRFLANMSHELRTPLNAVIGFSDVMRQEMFGPVGAPKYKEYAGLIHDSGKHLLDLINDILDTSKVEAGKYELTYEPVDVRELIGRCLDTVRVSAERKKVKLTANVGYAPGFVADARALKQILLNLLSNAIKFTPAGGTVEIASACRAGWVCFGVSDDGVGIAEDDLAKLGRPFEQAAGAYTRDHEGTGLGLSLVKAFAELHGGRMEMESALGEGTIVRVYVPLTPQLAMKVAAE